MSENVREAHTFPKAFPVRGSRRTWKHFSGMCLCPVLVLATGGDQKGSFLLGIHQGGVPSVDTELLDFHRRIIQAPTWSSLVKDSPVLVSVRWRAVTVGEQSLKAGPGSSIKKRGVHTNVWIPIFEVQVVFTWD